MAGNREGGLKAAITNKARHGENFYTEMGRKGGKVSRGGGFVGEEGRLRAIQAGIKGGSTPRRTRGER